MSVFMRCGLLCILSIIFSLHIGGGVYATEVTTLSNPTLVAASAKIHTAIQTKYTNASTPLGTKLELSEQQKQLDTTLASVEQAVKTKDKVLFTKSLSQFRSQYLALKNLLARADTTVSAPTTVEPTQSGPEKPASILYYSDSFE